MTEKDNCVIHWIDVKKALSEAVAAIYFADNSDYLFALWEVVRALGGEKAVILLEKDSNAAFEKYCADCQKKQTGERNQ